MDLKLSDKVYLVAGSSRGIGLGIAKCFLEEGAKVVITGRNEKSVTIACDSLNNLYPGHVLPLVGDVGEKEVIFSHLEKTICHFKRIDGVIANVGNGREPLGLPDDDALWEKSYHTNFKTSLLLAKYSFPYLQKQNSSTFTFISSITGLEDIGAPIFYSIYKSAIHGVSKMLSREFAKSGIRVNTVAPGNIFFEGGSWDKKIKENPDKIQDYINKEVPLKCFGTPKDIGHICTFLASDKAKFITGSVIVADGGQTRSF